MRFIYNHLYRAYVRQYDDRHSAIVFAVLWVSLTQALILTLPLVVLSEKYGWSIFLFENKHGFWLVSIPILTLNIFYILLQKKEIIKERYHSEEEEVKAWKRLSIFFLAFMAVGALVFWLILK